MFLIKCEALVFIPISVLGDETPHDETLFIISLEFIQWNPYSWLVLAACLPACVWGVGEAFMTHMGHL